MPQQRRTSRQHHRSKGSIINERKKELGSIKTLMDMNSPKARSEIIKYIEKHPDDMYGYYYYGKIAQISGDLDTAQEAYQTVADSDSVIRFAGMVGCGEVARLRGDHQTAKRLYQQAIAESPHEEVYASHALARLERLAGNYEEALRVLDTLHTTKTSVQLEKVRLLGICGKTQAAIKLAATITPENTSQVRELASLNAMNAAALGEYDKAKSYYAQARECGPKDSEYYKVLNDEARMHIELEEYQEAADCCEESYNAGVTQFGNTNLLLGIAKQGLKDYFAAAKNFKIAAEESQKTDLHNYSTSKYYLAYLELSAGDFESAEKNLRESIIPGQRPASSAVGLLLLIYIKQKRFAEAKAFLDEVRSKYSMKDAEAQLDLAELLIDKATGKPLPSRNNETYRNRQIIRYSQSDAISHIRSHHMSNPKSNCFPATTDIEQLYGEIQLQMTPENKVENDFMDKYFIDYPNSGYTPSGAITHQICVVALPGTLDILTMYPTEEKADLLRRSDLAKSLGIQKSKANDRISKFNARFANFTSPK